MHGFITTTVVRYDAAERSLPAEGRFKSPSRYEDF
jgi:hypothetical protein